MGEEKPGVGTAAHRFSSLLTFREPYTQEAYECARVTIPHEFPEAFHTGSDRMRLRDEVFTANQDLGARGVNNLSEKIHLSILPPNISLVKYEPEARAKAFTPPEDLAEVEKLLALRERVLTASIDSARYRPKLSPAARQLVIAGNYLINHVDKKMRGFKLHRYVVKRDAHGDVFEIVLKENLDYATLDARTRAIVDESRMSGTEDSSEERDVEVYTWVKRDGKTFHHHQEVNGTLIPGTEGMSPVAAPQWIVCTMYRTDGEDYGRSHVAQYLGALQKYDSLSQSVEEDAQIAALAIPLIHPNGQTDLEDILSAKNGQAISGREEDVGWMKMNKNADLQVADRVMQRLETSLSFAFLLNSAVRRQAERVTAEEIRQIAQELDAGLGGFYSTLTEELQLPLVLGHERDLERSGELEPLDPDLVTPVIMTGLESIGRGQDATNMSLLAQDLSIWAQILASPLGSGFKQSGLVARLADARSVEMNSIHMTEEELEQKKQQEQQQAMQAQMASDLGPSMIDAASSQAQQQ